MSCDVRDLGLLPCCASLISVLVISINKSRRRRVRNLSTTFRSKIEGSNLCLGSKHKICHTHIVEVMILRS